MIQTSSSLKTSLPKLSLSEDLQGQNPDQVHTTLKSLQSTAPQLARKKTIPKLGAYGESGIILTVPITNLPHL